MLNVCSMLTFLKRWNRSLWSHVFFLIFSMVLVVETLNAGQGQRHPSAEPQLRAAQPDLRGPRPRRAASEGYAFSPCLMFFSIISSLFPSLLLTNATGLQWQPDVEVQRADCAVYLCLHQVLLHPHLSLWPSSPSLSRRDSNVVVLFFFLLLFWKTYHEQQPILHLWSETLKW